MNRLLARVYSACICIVVMQLSSFVYAAETKLIAEPSGAVTLAAAVNAALKNNPDLAVTSYELKIADARITQAGLRRNPELSVNVENFAGTGDLKGTKSVETTLALSQVIELGGKRNYRLSVAGFDRELSGVDRQAQQLDVLASVTRKFVAVVTAQQAVALSQRAITLAEQTLTSITARVQAARSPQAEQSRASIAVTRARIEQQQAISNLQSARQALAALWGGRSAVFTSASADLFTLPVVQSFDALTARLQSNPDFLRFATEARLREAQLRLAQAQAKPNFNISLGVKRFEVTSDVALVAGVAIPLQIFDRNQGAIREAEVRREQLRVQSQAALIRAESTLYGLYQELIAARSRFETLRDTAIPQAQAALEQTQVGYERGRFSYLELASAQQELLALENAGLDAATDYHLQLIEIERLTAEPLVN